MGLVIQAFGRWRQIRSSNLGLRVPKESEGGKWKGRGTSGREGRKHWEGGKGKGGGKEKRRRKETEKEEGEAPGVIWSPPRARGNGPARLCDVIRNPTRRGGWPRRLEGPRGAKMSEGSTDDPGRGSSRQRATHPGRTRGDRACGKAGWLPWSPEGDRCGENGGQWTCRTRRLPSPCLPSWGAVLTLHTMTLGPRPASRSPWYLFCKETVTTCLPYRLTSSLLPLDILFRSTWKPFVSGLYCCVNFTK